MSDSDSPTPPESDIQPSVSSGETCFWCEETIEPHTPCITVSFKLPKVLFVSLGKTTEYAHPNCADRVARRLSEAAGEAREIKIEEEADGSE